MSIKNEFLGVAAADIIPERLSHANAIRQNFGFLSDGFGGFLKEAMAQAGANIETDFIVHPVEVPEMLQLEQDFTLKLCSEIRLDIELWLDLHGLYREINALEADGRPVDVPALVERNLMVGPFVTACNHKMDCGEGKLWFPRLQPQEEGGPSREDYQLSNEVDRGDFFAGIGRAIAFCRTFCEARIHSETEIQKSPSP